MRAFHLGRGLRWDSVKEDDDDDDDVGSSQAGRKSSNWHAQCVCITRVAKNPMCGSHLRPTDARTLDILMRHWMQALSSRAACASVSIWGTSLRLSIFNQHMLQNCVRTVK